MMVEEGKGCNKTSYCCSVYPPQCDCLSLKHTNTGSTEGKTRHAGPLINSPCSCSKTDSALGSCTCVGCMTGAFGNRESDCTRRALEPLTSCVHLHVHVHVHVLYDMMRRPRLYKYMYLIFHLHNIDERRLIVIHRFLLSYTQCTNISSVLSQGARQDKPISGDGRLSAVFLPQASSAFATKGPTDFRAYLTCIGCMYSS